MVREESGSLNMAMDDSFETETADRTNAILNLTQPLMTAAISGVIGLLAVTLISAMRAMYEGFG